MEGLTRVMLPQWPVLMLECVQAAQIDSQNIMSFMSRLSLGTEYIFWNHIDEWKAAHYDIKDSLNQDLYKEAGYYFGHALVEVSGSA